MALLDFLGIKKRAQLTKDKKMTLTERINNIGCVAAAILCIYTAYAIPYSAYQIITNKRYEESYNGKVVDVIHDNIFEDNFSIVIEDERGTRKMLSDRVGLTAPGYINTGDIIEVDVTYMDPVRVCPFLEKKTKEF